MVQLDGGAGLRPYVLDIAGLQGVARLVGLVHDREVLAAAGDGALAGVDEPAHRCDGLAGHVDQLNQQDHDANAVGALRGLHEDDGVDGEEHHVQDRAPSGVHAVPEP